MQSLAVTCTFYEKEGARASCQHDTLCNCGGLPASTTTVKNANPTVGTPRSMLKSSPPRLHRHGTPPRTGNGMLIDPPSFSDLKSSSLLLEMYFPRLAVHNGMCFSIQQTECACPCCVLYKHSRAAKRPLTASLPDTPALGHRRCLIAFTVFRGAGNDPEMFSVADRQEKNLTPLSKQLRCMFSRFCTPSHRLP